MNKVFATVNVTEAPQQEYISDSRTIVKCNVEIPATNSKTSPTPVTYHVWKDQDKIMSAVKPGMQLYIVGAKLRHNLKDRTYSLHDGSWVVVPAGQFPLLNEIILSGRCIKDIDPSDARQHKKTESGFMITSQSLSVYRAKQETDLFNLKAISKVDDKVRYAEWLLTMTRKGTGLTVSGKIQTSSWTDQNSGEHKSNTEIQVNSMTLAPKPQAGEIKPQTTTSSEQPQSLWSNQGGGAAPVWGSNSESTAEADEALADQPF